mmetsp:Transcript_41824/g.55142  ORF Transcript_41824/g.55142 Transcript_41824/m.55142 type:complete len:118 (+) Transcript_41824:171-524(+)
MELHLSPVRSKSRVKPGMVSSASEPVKDESGHSMDDLAEGDTSMKDLIQQINAMNDKIPKRLDKFQQQLEEKQKVTDAKFKRMIKESTDKSFKVVRGQTEKIDKLQKGLQAFQNMFN